METLETMIKKYVITAAEVGAKPNFNQLKSYETYAKKEGAEIVIIPTFGQYTDGELHEVFNNYKVVSDTKLGKNISIKNFNIKSQIINPLTGLKRFGAVDSSLIIGSPKQHLEHVANSNKNKPKAIMSTGSVTSPFYNTSTRIGKIALEDHVQGAVLLELNTRTGYFYFRQVQNTSDGSFISKGYKYTPQGKIIDSRADSIVLGDLHEAQLDESSYSVSCNMIKRLKPKYVVLHDIFDAYSVTHHDNGRNLLKARKQQGGYLSLKTELYNLGERLQHLCSQGSSDTKYIVVKSNHDEHLTRYLDECRFTGDPENLSLSVQLANAMINGKDPIEVGVMLTYGKLPKNIKFLQRDDGFSRYGFCLSMHGDKGVSGSKGSITSFDYSLGKAVIGHNHSAAIRKSIYRVGALERTDVEYTKGSVGNWTATNCAIYQNGKAELLSIYNGDWEL